MKFSQMKQSKYLKADDFDAPAKLTIKRFAIEPMDDGKDKSIVYFLEREKGMVLNSTNLTALENIFGEDSGLALGKTVVLFLVDTTKKDGTPCKGMRLRAPKEAKPVQVPVEDDMEDEIPF